MPRVAHKQDESRQKLTDRILRCSHLDRAVPETHLPNALLAHCLASSDRRRLDRFTDRFRVPFSSRSRPAPFAARPRPRPPPLKGKRSFCKPGHRPQDLCALQDGRMFLTRSAVSRDLRRCPGPRKLRNQASCSRPRVLRSRHGRRAVRRHAGRLKLSAADGSWASARGTRERVIHGGSFWKLLGGPDDSLEAN